MSDEKPMHSPGPWRASGSSVDGADGRLLFSASKKPPEFPRTMAASEAFYAELDANARLAAAAPDLLAAAKNAAEALENHDSIPWHGDLAAALSVLREAIAKAEGKP